MADSARPLRVGIIGAGGIARGYHLPAYAHCANTQVVAACDVNAAALDEMRQAHQIARTYGRYQDLLAAEDLDIVSICTSNDMHYPVVMAAIERGVGIFCEKPLALDLAQAHEMYAAAQAKRIRTGVNFSHRSTPASALAREIIASGALGDIHYVSAVYAAGGLNYADHAATWRNDRAHAGFGGLGDMGSHVMDMVRWWLGSEVLSVAAQAHTYVPLRPSAAGGAPVAVTTEDQGMLLMGYDNGAMGYLCGSYMFTGRGYDQRIEVYGGRGGLMYDQQRPYELQVRLEADYLSAYTVSRQGGTADTPYTTILVPERLQGWLPGKVRARRNVLTDFIEALKVQAILEAARAALDERRWVDVSPAEA
jgi:predicted dehydrogenase